MARDHLRRTIGVGALLLALGCNEPIDEPCEVTTQCAAGDVCVSGRCVLDGSGREGEGELPCGEAIAGVERAAFDAESGSCYVVIEDLRLDFVAAAAACEEVGGHLAIPDIASENDVIAPLASESMWLGISDFGDDLTAFGIFNSVNGGGDGFRNFAAGEPVLAGGTESCVQMLVDGSWATVACTLTRAFACEIEAEICGDGVAQESFGEECDDRNATNGDGCENDCTLECGAGTGATRAIVNPADDHCFAYFADQILSWQDAGDACDSIGGFSLVPDDAEENTLAMSIFTSFRAWIGFSDVATEAGTNGAAFTPVAGSTTFRNFGVGEPNDANAGEDCVELLSTGTWNDQPCDLRFRYVCELP